ncbi:MAG: hypothetical protein DI598_06890 [Pseudopedobacter saltans]|uniref:Substrate import-associated zinc metallohydrolase lipoprotein n=1 Tax=Pseudopedobacter saltans TaxID=151895 RepID=A0A2W5F7S6_9SPHI|nr:MAG: hypothetical protein DI598_06890 [Pseudopedobacter saltans]
MFSKKTRSTVFCLMILSFFSCKKDDFTPVDIYTLNPDLTAVNSELDAWLKTTFLDPYNISVSYRYNQYMHENDRNVSPVDPQFVKPFMANIYTGFLLPYEKVAGSTFIKKYAPKEIVLWGSLNYQSANSALLGDASAGARINMYQLNSYTPSVSFAKDRIGVIHHEFVHILNQTYPRPLDFETISAGSYNATYTNVTPDQARNTGFVTPYASSRAEEDFSEMAKALLVFGPSWFDNWVKTSTSGATALRRKETSLVDYYGTMGVNLRDLQKAVQIYLSDTLKDVSVSFPYWLNQGTLYTGLTVNLSNTMYTQYGQSSLFATQYGRLRDSMAVASRTLTSLQFLFTKKDSLTLRINSTTATGTSFVVDNDFSMKINEATGGVQFAKVANKVGTNYTNNSILGTKLTNTIIAYLVNNSFVGAWLQANMPGSMYTKTAGFYVANDPTNYFYGTLTQ